MFLKKILNNFLEGLVNKKKFVEKNFDSLKKQLHQIYKPRCHEEKQVNIFFWFESLYFFKIFFLFKIF